MRFTHLFMAALALVMPLPAVATATDYNATPATYQAQLANLNAGDRLVLASGTYTNGLTINGKNGTNASWITIVGPADHSAVFVAKDGRNTIEFVNASYVALENVTVDGLNKADLHAVSAKGGAGNVVHHIRIENCRIVNHGATQQTVGISTKTPTWGWVIRGNRITGAGTGMYLGNSNGAEPFIGGIIEGNLIEDTVGYNMQIKHQTARPNHPGIPTGAEKTIIRNNVFIKNSNNAPDGNRPNLLVGHFPPAGNGSSDFYEIHGNLFFHNPHEHLLQAEGRVIIHDNIFVDCDQTAVRLQDHNGTLDVAYVYNNTVYDCLRAIHFGSAARVDHQVIGNAVFTTSVAANAISGNVTNQSGNVTGTNATAGSVFVNPGTTLGTMDFYPQNGQLQGGAMNIGQFSAHTDHDLDFNGDSKGSFTFRGAYAGDGSNGGWQLDRAFKTGGPGQAPPNVPARANATASGPMVINATITLDGTGSSDGGDGPQALSYSWTQTSGPSVGLSGAATDTATFQPTIAGSYTFQLTVSDGASIDSDSVTTVIIDPTLTINGGDWQLRVASTSDVPVVEQRSLTNNGGGTLTVSVASSETWLIASFDNGAGGSTLGSGGSGTVQVRVDSVAGLGASNTATLTIIGTDGSTHQVDITVTLTNSLNGGLGTGGGSGCAAVARGGPEFLLVWVVVIVVLITQRR